mmetsp:Transcript_27477/g.37760  ORF Transcript_27477/g.37760 Transcript_27477/m.37760 type:complete len:575 (+) Transcript_27477:1141-2865(+)
MASTSRQALSMAKRSSTSMALRRRFLALRRGPARSYTRCTLSTKARSTPSWRASRRDCSTVSQCWSSQARNCSSCFTTTRRRRRTCSSCRAFSTKGWVCMSRRSLRRSRRCSWPASSCCSAVPRSSSSASCSFSSRSITLATLTSLEKSCAIAPCGLLSRPCFSMVASRSLTSWVWRLCNTWRSCSRYLMASIILRTRNRRACFCSTTAQRSCSRRSSSRRSRAAWSSLRSSLACSMHRNRRPARCSRSAYTVTRTALSRSSPRRCPLVFRNTFELPTCQSSRANAPSAVTISSSWQQKALSCGCPLASLLTNCLRWASRRAGSPSSSTWKALAKALRLARYAKPLLRIRMASNSPAYRSCRRASGPSKRPPFFCWFGLTQRMKCGSVRRRFRTSPTSWLRNCEPRVALAGCPDPLPRPRLNSLAATASAEGANSSASSGSEDSSSTSREVLLSESLFFSTKPVTEYSTSPAKWLTEKHSGRTLFFLKWSFRAGRPSPNSFWTLAMKSRSDPLAPTEHSSSRRLMRPVRPSMSSTQGPLSSKTTCDRAMPSCSYMSRSCEKITSLKWNCSFSLA